MTHPVLPALADRLFRSPSNPEVAFAHSAWQCARAAALDALNTDGVTVLLGPPGSGKSLLLRDLAYTLRLAGRAVRLIGQTGTLDCKSSDGILLVDEADRFGADALAALCADPSPTLLAALPGSAEQLARLPLPMRRITLGRISPVDLARYVALQLAAAGRSRDLFEPEAVLALAQHSGGLLRLVNTLGAAAVFSAGLEHSLRVGRRHVEEAAFMRGDVDGNVAGIPEAEPAVALSAVLISSLPVPPRSKSECELFRRRAALTTAAAACGVLFALPWFNRRPPGAQPSRAHAAAGAIQAAISGTGGSTPAAAPGASDLQAGRPDPGAVLLRPAARPPPSHSEPGRDADKVLSTAMASDGGGVLPGAAAVVFAGPIYNATMGQGGHLTLLIRKQLPTSVLTAQFNATQGLSGSGVLAGNASEAGRITASGQLRMGRNAFLCDLAGIIAGGRLTGTAVFTRSGGSGWTTRSTFNLTQA